MIKSMTGFGKGEFTDGKRNVICEIRAVNHRYSDISVKMPRRYAFAEEKIKAINPDELCKIKFVDNAPRSVKYFKLLSGLLENPVGQIKVHFSVPGMHIVIFEGDKKSAKVLIPENNPVDKVIRGQIGITNMASKSSGLIGIRFEDNFEFGPTAESFDATNIIGDVVSDYDNLENLKEGVVVYVTESNHES